jgi:hypothetical protein
MKGRAGSGGPDGISPPGDHPGEVRALASERRGHRTLLDDAASEPTTTGVRHAIDPLH